MINTLIVDDSPLARDIIRDFLEAGRDFKIIGEAADGEDAIRKILSLDPDLVTLDIEMPQKNGLEVIEAVIKKTSVPIVVITSNDTAKTAYEASLKGALEFYSKTTFTAALSPEKRQEIYETLKRISSIKAQKNRASAAAPVSSGEPKGPAAPVRDFPPLKREIRAVVVAASTGGPKALSAFFSQLPGNFPLPIAVVQHNSSGFDKCFAQWLDSCTQLTVKLAEEGEAPKPGTVYIAMTDKHLELRRTNGEDCVFCYTDAEPDCNQKPAANVLFRSAAESFGKSLVSIVLTGMGADGAAGTRNVREMGGITLAQDEESSLIYGMPKAAAETGCVDIVLPLNKIPEELLKLLSFSF